MVRLIACISSWSRHGALQAHIDLAALNHTLKNYMTHSAINYFQEANELLPKLNIEDQRFVQLNLDLLFQQ